MTPPKDDKTLVELANRFNEVWYSGGQPELDDFLQQVAPEQRAALSQLLTPIDAKYRRQRGLAPQSEQEEQDQTGEYSADHSPDPLANTLATVEAPKGGESKGGESKGGESKGGESKGGDLAGVASLDYTFDLDEESAVVETTRATIIGPYQLLQKLGEGGMGEVWMAQQEKPVRRRVALKLIKSGIDNKQILVRFEAERQALAMMDHPNIAKVLDVGKTPNGQPFFVMELLKGQTLTRYCDENKVSIEERLKLFLDVCSGVQHAHQKGIIHRDLKPGNIIVDTYDGKPVPNPL